MPGTFRVDQNALYGFIKVNHPNALYGQQHMKSLSEVKMISLHAYNKGTDQTVLSSTQPGQRICHSFSVKYIL